MNLRDIQTSASEPQLLDQQNTPISIRGWVFVVFFVSWVVRFTFIGHPIDMTADEFMALLASGEGIASEFISTSNWAIRWRILETHSSGGRIGWILWYLLWGSFIPNPGTMAFVLNAIMAVVAMTSLAGASRRIFGERGFLLTLLLASVSPLFLNYTVRILGTMPSTMFVCLAIFFFSAHRGSVRNWIAGGLCMGLSFGTHYGSGVTNLGIAFGLAISIAFRLFERDVPVRRKLRECLIGPVIGAVSSTLPLLLLEFWARYAGTSYYKRLISHENIVNPEWKDLHGPMGLWMRYLLELDPLLEIFFVLAVIQGFRTTLLRRDQKLLLALFTIPLCVIVFPSFTGGPARAYISVLLFLGLGIAAAFTRVLHWRRLSGSTPCDPSETPISTKPILDFRGIAAAIIVMAAIYSTPKLSALSELPRLTFPSWPLFILGLTGLMLRTLGQQFNAVIRLGSFAGAIFLLVGAWALFEHKCIYIRTLAYREHHPYMASSDFWAFMGTPATYDHIASRAGDDDPVVIGPSVWLYPASPYEEEYFKHVRINEQLKERGLDYLLSSYQLVYATVFYERSTTAEGSVLPAGAPEIPPDIRVLDAEGRTYPNHAHPYRGLEVQTPALKNGGNAEISIEFDLPTNKGVENRFGFEYQTVTSAWPHDTTLMLITKQGDEIIGSIGAELRDRAGSWQLLETRFIPHNDVETMKVGLKLSVPEGAYCPPISFYMRRPAVWLTPSKGGASGFAMAIASDEFKPAYPSLTTDAADLHFSRLADKLQGKGITWRTDPWSGKSAERLAFAGSFEYAPICQLSINNQIIMEFTPTAKDETWEQNGFKLEYKHFNMNSGNHGIFVMTLPEGYSEAGAPLEMNVKITGGEIPNAWFGIRVMRDVMGLLPQNPGAPQE